MKKEEKKSEKKQPSGSSPLGVRGASKPVNERNKKIIYLGVFLVSLVIIVILIWIVSAENKKTSTSYSSGYSSSRVTLRSSYKTISSYSEQRALFKRKGFFSTDDNLSGNFTNDFIEKTIRGDKVIVDRATGLMWHQGGSSSSVIFSKAKDWISSLNSRGYAGYYDWRLPTLEEGTSLLESSKRNGVYIDPAFDSEQFYIWTGDNYDSKSGWIVRFDYGDVNWSNFNHDYYVRPVRSIK